MSKLWMPLNAGFAFKAYSVWRERCKFRRELMIMYKADLYIERTLANEQRTTEDSMDMTTRGRL